MGSIWIFFWIIAILGIVISVEMYIKSRNKPLAIPSWWYLLPFYGGIVGGLVGWLAHHREHPKEARTLLIGGVIVTIFLIIISRL
jgi:hypothetical protein